jgi:hypothetical protein
VKPTPAGLESAGKRLWRSALGVYEFALHKLQLLERAARCADRLAKDRRSGREDDADCRLVGRAGQAASVVPAGAGGGPDACKLLAELHLPAEIPPELERDVAAASAPDRGGCLMRHPEGVHGLMEAVDWSPEVFRGFVRELIQDIKRHGMDRATTRELMLPAALRTDWLSPVRGDAGRGGVA